jgi:hypothetical protein
VAAKLESVQDEAAEIANGFAVLPSGIRSQYSAAAPRHAEWQRTLGKFCTSAA